LGPGNTVPVQGKQSNRCNFVDFSACVKLEQSPLLMKGRQRVKSFFSQSPYNLGGKELSPNPKSLTGG
jgi:hypothetical protein